MVITYAEDGLLSSEDSSKSNDIEYNHRCFLQDADAGEDEICKSDNHVRWETNSENLKRSAQANSNLARNILSRALASEDLARALRSRVKKQYI